jgi:hypothetical protein
MKRPTLQQWSRRSDLQKSVPVSRRQHPSLFLLRQVAGLFVAEERGNCTLKGVPEPVTSFRIMRASGGGRRAGQRRLTPLVGRDESGPVAELVGI